MHIQQISDSMSCTVIIIQTMLPEYLSRHIIQAQTAAALKEFYMTQAQHTHKNHGIVLLLFLCYRSQRKGSCNVCRSLQILSAGVNQIKSLRFQNRAGFRNCMIMTHGCIGSICGNRCKALIQGAIVQTHLIQTICCCTFCHGNLADIFLHPVNEFRHGHAVFDVSSLHVFNFYRILLRLRQGSRIHFVQDPVAAVQRTDDGIIDLSLLQKHTAAAYGSYIIIYIFISP